MTEQPKFMDIQRDYFLWSRPDAGFVWNNEATTEKSFPKSFKDGKGSVPQIEGPFLIEAPDTTSYRMTNEHDTTAFKEFAELDGTELSILTFANKYGMLTHGEAEVTTPLYNGTKKPFRYLAHINCDGEFYSLPGESLSFWQREIREMKQTHLVWEWMKNNDLKWLRKVIKWSNDGRSVQYILGDEYALERLSKSRSILEVKDIKGPTKLTSADGSNPIMVPPEGLEAGRYTVDNSGNLKKVDFYWRKGLLAGEDEHPNIFKRFKRGALKLPALYLVQTSINKKLDELGTIGPRLLINDSNELEPYLVPDSLLGALWLQFYKAAYGERKYDRCSVCGFWVDTTENNSDWSMHPGCSDTKRSREYRLRQSIQRNYMAIFGVSKEEAKVWLKDYKDKSDKKYEEILKELKKKRKKQVNR